jgi:hypothetical protein
MLSKTRTKYYFLIVQLFTETQPINLLLYQQVKENAKLDLVMVILFNPANAKNISHQRILSFT